MKLGCLPNAVALLCTLWHAVDCQAAQTARHACCSGFLSVCRYDAHWQDPLAGKHLPRLQAAAAPAARRSHALMPQPARSPHRLAPSTVDTHAFVMPLQTCSSEAPPTMPWPPGLRRWRMSCAAAAWCSCSRQVGAAAAVQRCVVPCRQVHPFVVGPLVCLYNFPPCLQRMQAGRVRP